MNFFTIPNTNPTYKYFNLYKTRLNINATFEFLSKDLICKPLKKY